MIHTAQPMHSKTVTTDEDYVQPALSGMKYILEACIQPKSIVERMIYTSSVGAS